MHEAGRAERRQRDTVDFVGQRLLPVIAYQVCRERQEADQQQVDEIDPDEDSVGTLNVVELDVMVDPVRADQDEADHVDDEMPLEAEQVLPQRVVGREREVLRELQVEDERRQRDGKDAVDQRFEAVLFETAGAWSR